MTLGPGTQVHSRSGRVSHWGAIWLPVRELIQYGAALTGAPFVVPLAIQTWRPPRAAGRHLRSLHAAAIRMADIRPRALLGTDAVHALEQQLIEAVVDCLSEGSGDTGSAPARQNQDIMARFERLLQTQSDR